MGKLRQEILEFKAHLDYMAIPCLTHKTGKEYKILLLGYWVRPSSSWELVNPVAWLFVSVWSQYLLFPLHFTVCWHGRIFFSLLWLKSFLSCTPWAPSAFSLPRLSRISIALSSFLLSFFHNSIFFQNSWFYQLILYAWVVCLNVCPCNVCVVPLKVRRGCWIPYSWS